jgi:predicted esterase
MCISGGLLNQDANIATATMRQLPLYVVTGTDDNVVDTAYTTASAGYMASFNDRVSFYPVDGGTHRIVTLLPRLRQAWTDMHAGTVRQVPSDFARVFLPRAPSTMGSEKP